MSRDHPSTTERGHRGRDRSPSASARIVKTPSSHPEEASAAGILCPFPQDLPFFLGLEASRLLFAWASPQRIMACSKFSSHRPRVIGGLDSDDSKGRVSAASLARSGSRRNAASAAASLRHMLPVGRPRARRRRIARRCPAGSRPRIVPGLACDRDQRTEPVRVDVLDGQKTAFAVEVNRRCWRKAASRRPASVDQMDRDPVGRILDAGDILDPGELPEVDGDLILVDLALREFQKLAGPRLPWRSPGPASRTPRHRRGTRPEGGASARCRGT